MRTDYAYIRSACSAVLDVTPKGQELLESEDFEDEPTVENQLVELLLACENDYFEVVPKGGDALKGGMREWYEEFVKQYAECYGSSWLIGPPEIGWAAFKRAFDEGYLTIRLVIWDSKLEPDGVLGKHIHLEELYEEFKTVLYNDRLHDLIGEAVERVWPYTDELNEERSAARFDEHFNEVLILLLARHIKTLMKGDASD